MNRPSAASQLGQSRDAPGVVREWPRSARFSRGIQRLGSAAVYDSQPLTIRSAQRDIPTHARHEEPPISGTSGSNPSMAPAALVRFHLPRWPASALEELPIFLADSNSVRRSGRSDSIRMVSPRNRTDLNGSKTPRQPNSDSSSPLVFYSCPTVPKPSLRMLAPLRFAIIHDNVDPGNRLPHASLRKSPRH